MCAGVAAIAAARPLSHIWDELQNKLRGFPGRSIIRYGIGIGVAAASITAGAIITQRGTGTGGGGSFSYGAPNTPTSSVAVLEGDTAAIVTGSAFVGSGDDTMDSLAVQVDTAGGDFSSPQYLNSTRNTTDVADTTYALDAGAIAKARVRYHGTNGGWSAWSDTVQFTATFLWLANLPSGLTEVVDYDFSNAGDLSYSGLYGNSAAVYDGAALSPPVSPDDVARMVLDAGTMPAEGGFSIGSRSVSVPAGTVRIYITAVFQPAANYTWHTGNHKFFYFYTHAESPTVGSVVLGIDPTRGDDGATDGKAYWNADPQVYTGGQNVFTINQSVGVSDSTATRSEWNYIEMEVVMNTDENTSDGILHVWHNGTLIISRTDVLWSDNASYLSWELANLDPYYGGQNASHSVPTETYIYIDHFTVYSSTSRS